MIISSQYCEKLIKSDRVRGYLWSTPSGSISVTSTAQVLAATMLLGRALAAIRFIEFSIPGASRRHLQGVLSVVKKPNSFQSLRSAAFLIAKTPFERLLRDHRKKFLRLSRLREWFIIPPASCAVSCAASVGSRDKNYLEKTPGNPPRKVRDDEKQLRSELCSQLCRN